MRFIAGITAAILANTAVAAPFQPLIGSNEGTLDHGSLNIVDPVEPRGIEPLDAQQLPPIPLAVSPNGIIEPDSAFPQVVDTDSQQEEEESDASQAPARRAAPIKTKETDAYRMGCKFDLQTSFLELKDKLVYLNRHHGLTEDEANRQINAHAHFVMASIKRNHLLELPNFDGLFAELRSLIAAEIAAHPQPTLPPVSMNQTQTELSRLHAYYLILSLEVKIEVMARANLLDQTIGRRAVSATREMLNSGTQIPEEELASYHRQVTQIEAAMNTMAQHHLTKFPAESLPENTRPAAFDFADDESPSLTKRDDDPSPTSPIPATAAPELVVDPHSFWSDFGAPECMSILTDNDVSLTSEVLDRFSQCQERIGQLAPMPKPDRRGPLDVAEEDEAEFAAPNEEDPVPRG